MTSAHEAEDETARPPNIGSLTGIRFVASLTIVLAHIYPPVGALSLIGMPLFFTLSGFIIHYVYSDAFAVEWRTAATRFAAARFSRIYPLYLILLIVEAVATPLGQAIYQSRDVRAVLAYVLACWTWLPLTVDGHPLQTRDYAVSWSVSTEIFFYVAYALAFYRLRLIRSVKLCLTALLVFCAGVYALFYLLFLTRDAWEAFALHYVSGFSARSVDFDNSFYRWFLYISPYCRLFEFVGGCLTCQLFLLSRRNRRRWRRVHHLASVAALLIAAVVLTYDHVAADWPWLAAGNHSLVSFFICLHMNFLLAPLCYLLIFSLADAGSALSRMLSSRAAVFLGEISYSTYLGHPLAMAFVLASSLGNVRHVTTAIELLTIYVVSWMFYSAFELPAKAALRRFFARRQGKAHRQGVVAGE